MVRSWENRETANGCDVSDEVDSLREGISIDGESLMGILASLAGFGDLRPSGLDRVAFSDQDLEARDWLDRRLEGLGLSVARDAIGNSVADLPGRNPELGWIAIGSHSDSVPSGGRYDGALGIAAAVACVEAIREGRLELRHGLRVVNFEAEEATMGGATLGSRAATGQVDPEEMGYRAYDGESVRSHLARAGLDPARASEAGGAGLNLVAFLELHIEQGPTLDQAGIPVGIVEGIAGIRRYEVDFRGTANHAGTTPMLNRDDALVAASEFVAAVPDIAIRNSIVATVGTLRVHPGAPNVIPGQVEISLECRSTTDDDLEAAEEELLDLGAALKASFTKFPPKLPQPFSLRLIELLETLCSESGIRAQRLWSGAGHDAGVMAQLTDAAMIFVPSRSGISHSGEEFTEPEDCRTGADLLLKAILELDSAEV